MAKTRTSFKPGQSGNPQGRPRVVFEIRDQARQFGPKGIIKLAQMAGLTDEPPAEAEIVRLGALRELLDRGFGKPTLPLAGDGEAPPVEISFSWAPALPDAARAATTETAAALNDESSETPIFSWDSTC